MRRRKDQDHSESVAPRLKDVAKRAGLTPGTVSAVLNDSPAARAIPQHTKDRVHEAARELNYSPNFLARSLRAKRTFTIGVITEEIGDPYGGMVISGIESYLTQRKYFFITVAHRHKDEQLKQYANILVSRGVEGLITIDTSLNETPPVPTVAVAGRRRVPDVTNVVLDQDYGAMMALKHLKDLGHREIALMKGQPFSSDSEDRWRAILAACHELNLPVRRSLTIQLNADDPSPSLAHRLTSELLDREPHFTAVFAYNDISAIGVIRAVRETGRRVPEDISVVGFDDIRDAAYHVPALTTIHQPLRRMGELAAETLVDRIENKTQYPHDIAVTPELIVRETTAAALQEQLQTVGGSLPFTRG